MMMIVFHKATREALVRFETDGRPPKKSEQVFIYEDICALEAEVRRLNSLLQAKVVHGGSRPKGAKQDA